MDKIFLRELATEAVIGFHDWERKVKQTLLIDLEIATDVSATASHDDIQRTFDYHAVARRVRTFVEESQFHLIETLAENVARVLLSEFGVKWVKVSVRKPGAIQFTREVGVEIERSA